jgi:hypothetical protein
MAGEGGSGGKGVPDNLLTVSWHDSAWIPVLSQAGHIQISQIVAKYLINTKIRYKILVLEKHTCVLALNT